MRDNNLLRQTLPEPNRPDSLPQKAQWLAGEGAGSWFMIKQHQSQFLYEVTRFSPKGKVECHGRFKMENPQTKLDLSQSYEFIHLSHCAEVKILQNDCIFILKAC